MRFTAISLLTILPVASVVGTVEILRANPSTPISTSSVRSGSPSSKLGRTPVIPTRRLVLVILASFLVLSITLAYIVRQTPPMLREMRSFRERARADLAATSFSRSASLPASASADAVERRPAIAHAGFLSQVADLKAPCSPPAGAAPDPRRLLPRPRRDRAPIHRRPAHDGNLPLRLLQVWLGDKHTTAGDQVVANIPSARLGTGNRTSAATSSSRGASTNCRVIGLCDGVTCCRNCPSASRKTGSTSNSGTAAPRLATSPASPTGRGSQTTQHHHRVYPLVDGITLYQSRASRMAARSWRSRRAACCLIRVLRGWRAWWAIAFADGAGFSLYAGIPDFRAFSGETCAATRRARRQAKTAPRKRGQASQRHLGGAESAEVRDLRNIGPNFTFKLRDQPASQA